MHIGCPKSLLGRISANKEIIPKNKCNVYYINRHGKYRYEVAQIVNLPCKPA